MHHPLGTRHSARVAVKVACRVEPANLQNRLTACLLMRQTAALIPIGQEVDVSRELFVEVLVQAAPAKDSHQAGPNFLKAPDHGVVPPPAVPSTRPMTDASRAQLAASAASAFSPARVSE